MPDPATHTISETGAITASVAPLVLEPVPAVPEPKVFVAPKRATGLLIVALILSTAALAAVLVIWSRQHSELSRLEEEHQELLAQSQSKDKALREMRVNAAQADQDISLERAKASDAQAAFAQLREEAEQQKTEAETRIQALQHAGELAQNSGGDPLAPKANTQTQELQQQLEAAYARIKELEQQEQKEKDARLRAEKSTGDLKKTTQAEDDQLKKEKAAREKAERDAKEQADAAKKAQAAETSAEKQVSTLQNQVNKLQGELEKALQRIHNLEGRKTKR
ncbi:MAG TPA: hypothetical protein VGP72_24465 [Planctomycetota bacterium]|jgi:colicin import membrane protein